MRYLSLFLLLFVSTTAASQDLIVFNTGDTLACKIVSVTKEKLYTDLSSDYEKTRINSYYINERWIQLGGPVAKGGATAFDGIDHRFEFEQSLGSAGGWLIGGIAVAGLTAGLGLLINDDSVRSTLFIAGSVFFPLSMIIAGVKLHKASVHHSKMKLD